MLDIISNNAGWLANLATVIGIPIAIMIFISEKRKERLDREYGTYHALDEKYAEYLRLCINHPRLNLYYQSLEATPELSDTEKIQQLAMFEILVSLMERAYLMYRDQDSAIKRSQWVGWRKYMEHWSTNPVFQENWQREVADYDSDFARFLQDLVLKAQADQKAAEAA